MVGPRLDLPEAPDLAWRIRETEAPVDLIERKGLYRSIRVTSLAELLAPCGVTRRCDELVARQQLARREPVDPG
jgi:hypothetical protein